MGAYDSGTRAALDGPGMLRRVTILGVMTGVIAIALGIAGGLLLRPSDGSTDPGSLVFAATLVIVGVLLLFMAVLAARAGKSFPHGAQFAARLDAAALFAIVIGVLGAIALVLVGPAAAAIVVIAVLFPVVVLRAAARKVFKASADDAVEQSAH